MRIGLHTTIWRRPALTRLFLDYWTQIGTPHELVHVCVISPEDQANRDLPERYPSVHFVGAPNSPLSDKHNVGMQALREYAPDLVCLVPSDDLFAPEYLHHIAEGAGHGYEAQRITSLWFHDLLTGRMIYGEQLGIGAGYALSPSLLDRIEWQPWRPGSDSGMDGNMFQVLDKTPRTRMEYSTLGRYGVDIKSSESRNSFDLLWNGLRFKDHFPPEHAAGWWREHFPSVAEQVIHGHAELAG